MNQLIIIAKCTLFVCARTTAALSNAIATETPVFVKAVAAARAEIIKAAGEEKFEEAVAEVMKAGVYYDGVTDHLGKELRKALGLKAKKAKKDDSDEE